MQCLPMSSVLETLFRMRGFLLGFLVCAMLCAGAYHQFLRPAPFDPCRVCSTGTRCVAEFCIAQAVQAQPVAKKRTARVRAANSTGGTPAVPNAAQTPTEAAGTGVDAPQVVLRDEDKRVKAVGDKLNTTEFLNMEEATVSDRQLSQQDFDQVFRPRQSEILGCIDDARGDALLEGHMAVAFRVRRSGQVSGVRVEAPAYLLDHGLYACVRKVVLGLSFPVSGSSQVVTYPFSLR